MTLRERHRLLFGLAEVVPEETRRELRRDDLCVLATRVGYDACRYFGIDARPMCVRVLATNRQWMEHAQKVAPEGLGDIDLNDPSWADAIAAGAHSVAIDERAAGPGRYAGHLVLAAPGKPGWYSDLLLDLSLRQFSRPTKGMRFPDAVVLPVDLAAIKADAPALLRTGDGAWVLYYPRERAPDWRQGPDWKRKQPLSGRVIRRLRDGAAK